MKKISVLFLTGMILSAFSFGQISDQDNQKQVQTVYEQIGASRDAANILVFRDQLPWGYNVVVPYLVGIGANVTTATSAQMASIDLSPFCMLIFESNQPAGFYATYVANLTKFTNYVTNGGVLEFHACVYSSTREVIGATPLPGGASTFATAYLDGNNYIVDAMHPIVLGLSDPLSGNYASHEAFTNLPANVTIITRNTSNLPTTIEYDLGAGRVVATGMTWEVAYGIGWSAGALLPKCLDYNVLNCHPNVPLNSWILVAGILAILSITIFRYRRMS